MKPLVRLRDLRERAGLSSLQLATEARTTVSQIAAWEAGPIEGERFDAGGVLDELSAVLRVARALGTTIADLMASRLPSRAQSSAT